MAWTAGTWTTGPYGVHTALDTNTIAWWQELPVRVVTAVLPWAVDRLVAARLALARIPRVYAKIGELTLRPVLVAVSVVRLHRPREGPTAWVHRPAGRPLR